MLQSILASILSILQTLLIVVGFGEPTTASPKLPNVMSDCDPMVFLTGLGGWGDEANLNAIMSYFGFSAGSLSEYLNEQGYEVHTADVGPVSSAWDRSCELYAYLTGTRVDYGAVHAKAHGHDRYGVTYEKAAVKGWGKERKVHLVGYSTGGAGVRMFAQLCEEGDAAEREGTPATELSPLFAGKAKGFVSSVTTIVAPNNGTTAIEWPNSLVGADVLQYVLLGFAGMGTVVPFIDTAFPFQLQQFGISYQNFYRKPVETLQNIGRFMDCDDTAKQDVTVDGAAQFNKIAKCQPDVYYFSYYACNTKDNGKGGQVPNEDVWSLLKPASYAMGRSGMNGYVTEGGIALDESWLANDGLVNTISAMYPLNQPHKDFDAKKMETGIWQVMPLDERYDHSDYGGGTQLANPDGAPEIREFYLNFMKMLEGLPD